jgi:mono/diheme cytochrome c family protein
MRRVATLVAPLVASVVLAAGDAETGKALYDKNCAQCHGDKGDGNGIATPRVLPKPRDFTSGKFKVRTTPSGSLPTDADIARSIRYGFPYTSMPAWPTFSDNEVLSLVAHVKSFAADAFADAERRKEPYDIPDPPSFSDESAAKGRELYLQNGCVQCHGDQGRGDGPSAPTLQDDWGNPLKPADLTMPWTFRGGATRQDIFRTFTTGMNGTPMPAYADSIAVDDRWHLVNYIASLSHGAERPGYTNLMTVRFVERDLDLSQGAALFDGAPKARFPLVGQIMEPVRNFHPLVTSLEAQAVHNRREVAIRLTWHDLRAERAGRNGPALPVPIEEEAAAAPAAGGEAEGDFWGEAAAPAQAAAADAGGGDFWGEEAPAAAGPAGEFSDAIALQLPKDTPTGIRKPYFLFGDSSAAVDLWFVDLAQSQVQQFVGKGSASLERVMTDQIDTLASYDNGEWSVVFKRSMSGEGGVPFVQGQYLPLAFSVWDGGSRERGSKRALSLWQYLYVEPAVQASTLGPVVRTGLLVLVVELVIVGLVRRKHALRPAGQPAGGAVRSAS